MKAHITVNGREVTNPVARRAIMAIVLLFAALFALLAIFVLIPLIGIALGVGAATLLFLAGSGLVSRQIRMGEREALPSNGGTDRTTSERLLSSHPDPHEGSKPIE